MIFQVLFVLIEKFNDSFKHISISVMDSDVVVQGG
jgi:hypothetical protein